MNVTTMTRRTARERIIAIIALAALMLATMVVFTAPVMAQEQAAAAEDNTAGTGITGLEASSHGMDANEQQIANKIKGGFFSIYNTIGAILTAVAVVCIGIAAFKWISGDPDSARQGKKAVISIAIGIALFWLAELIVVSIQNMVNPY